jgi:hypothetical protein
MPAAAAEHDTAHFHLLHFKSLNLYSLPHFLPEHRINRPHNLRRVNTLAQTTSE